jgi:8-oxoguanine deaminase
MRTLLKNIYHLYTGDGSRQRHRGVDLLIDGNAIVRIGRDIEAEGARVLDCSTKLVVPGLVNTHHHMYQTLQRNIPAAQNVELFDWLITLYPIWAHLDAEVIDVSTQLASAELLKTGCTTSSDHHYVFPQGVAEDLIATQFAAAEKIGIRFCATRGSMSRGKSSGGLPPDSVVQDEATILQDSKRLIESFHDDSRFSMRRLALAPCSPFSVSADLMKKTAELARQYGVYLHTHLAETRDEESYCLENYGKRPLALMADCDWLGKDVWYAHGIFFDDQELDQLAETGTGIAHCPSSNMRLGSGICRLLEMGKRNMRVGLAVDGSASNDSSDMLGELRNCLLLQRVKEGAAAIGAEEVFHIATRGSASLLGWDSIGSIEEGKAADLALFEMNRLDYAGALADPLAATIFSGSSHNADTTIVNGKIVVEGGRLVTIDEQELTDRANALCAKMLAAEGYSTEWIL